jgi:hypothetical protein
MEFKQNDLNNFYDRMNTFANSVKPIADNVNVLLQDSKKFLTPEQLKEVEAKFPNGETFKSVEHSLNNLQEILNKARK